MKRDALDPIFNYKETIDETLSKERETHKGEDEFELRGLIEEAIPLSKTTSVLKIHADEGMVELRNNKSIEYWKEQKKLHERAFIKGKKPHEKSGVSNIYYVQSGNQADIKEVCSPQDYFVMNALAEKLDPRFLNEIVQVSLDTEDHPGNDDGSALPVASTYDELVAFYLVMKKKYSPKDRQWLDHYFKKYPRAANDEKDRIRRRLYFTVNYCHGVSVSLLKMDPKLVRMQLDKVFPGQNNLKDALCQGLAAFQQDPQHRAPKILLHASEMYDLIRLVEAFFELAGIPYDEHSVVGCTDAANFQGSAAVYSNASLGSFAEKLALKGVGGLIIKGVDSYGSLEGVMPLATIAEGTYYNELLEQPVSLQSEFIVLTARDLDRVPFDTYRLTVLEPVDFTDEEMLGQFDVILRNFCAARHLPENYLEFDEEARREIALHFVPKNSVGSMRVIIEEVCQNAVTENGDSNRIHISLQDLGKYYSVLMEKPHLDRDYLATVDEIRKKCIVSLDYVPPCFHERLAALLEECNLEKDEAKKKVLEAKVVALGNIRIGNESAYDLDGVQREFSAIRGMHKAKETLLDDLHAASAGTNKRLKPKILVGPPGVGKTSLCDALGAGMRVPVVKIPFNQITDAREVSGYPSAFRDGRPGLLGRIAQKGANSLRCIVIIDEFDKPAYAGAYGPFYNLFDQQQAWDEWYETFFDTSEILFVCTVNDLGVIPYSLRDRCEILEINSYTCREQAEIAREVLIPRLAKDLGLNKKVTISEAILNRFVREYVTSSGVRGMEQNLEVILKRLARQGGRPCITEKILKECLGEPPEGRKSRVNALVPGVATALAVSSFGGSTFNVVAYRNPHGEEPLITGLAEGSMAESVQYAIATASRLLDRKIEHLAVHLEQAGVKKDGPSAGITLLMAVLSLEMSVALNGCGYGSVAFTGELSPAAGGLILPVGGVREKLIASSKAEINTVFLPWGNYERIRSDKELDAFDLRIVPVKTVSELVKKLFPSVKFSGV